MVNKEPRGPGNPSRKKLYAQAASHAPRAIEILAELMENGDNHNVRMGAARTLLAKAIPDLKALEVAGFDGKALKLMLDFKPDSHGNKVLRDIPAETAGGD